MLSITWESTHVDIHQHTAHHVSLIKHYHKDNEFGAIGSNCMPVFIGYYDIAINFEWLEIRGLTSLKKEQQTGYE
jgi:hypothetical protein